MPNWATIASRICCSVWHAAIRRATSAFIWFANGEFDSSSVVWHSRQTSSVSRCDWLACVVQAAAGAASTSAAATTTRALTS